MLLEGLFATETKLKCNNHDFNTGWKFIRDTLTGAEKTSFDNLGFTMVDLLHDYSIINLLGEDGVNIIEQMKKHLQD